MLGNGATAIKSRNSKEEQPRGKKAASFAITAKHQWTSNVWISLISHNSGINDAFLQLINLTNLAGFHNISRISSQNYG